MAEPETNPAERDAAGVKVWPPGVPLVILILGALLQRFAPLPNGWMPASPWSSILGWGIVIASVYFLGFQAVKTMRSTGQSEIPYKPSTEIVDRGPFGFTRNPMYLQMVLACLGFGIAFANPWLLIGTPLCALGLYALVIRYEEAYLTRKFGQAYLDYQARVRRWL